ncbi:unannotated protein [freshwater metagenome]|uniref:Unannotated protein n=1 Tax=freshwater metagenome TaxID=449393 RepID=A0A6J7DRD5_9ZZZZ
MDPLNVWGCRGCYLGSGASGTGNGHHVSTGVLHHQFACFAVATHHIEYARGQNFIDDFGHERGCHWRGVRWLHHDGVARRNGWRPLPHGHHHGVVPRRDLSNHTNGFATYKRGMPTHIFTSGSTFENASSTSEEANLIEHRRNFLRLSQADRLAGVLDFGLDELVRARFNQVRDLEHGHVTLSGSGVAPGLERLGRCRIRAIDIGATAQSCSPEHLTGSGINQVSRSTIGRINNFSIDHIADYSTHGVLPCATTVICPVRRLDLTRSRPTSRHNPRSGQRLTQGFRTKDYEIRTIRDLRLRIHLLASPMESRIGTWPPPSHPSGTAPKQSFWTM